MLRNLTCPICDTEYSVERMEEAPFRPFCSRRCKLIDLGRWLDGTYSISDPLPQDEPAQRPNLPIESDSSKEDDT